MKKTVILILFWLTFGLGADCQPEYPSLIAFEEIEFNSYFEEMSFMKFMNGEEDYVRLLFSVDPKMNQDRYEIFRHELLLQLKDFNKRKFRRASPEKKILFLHEDIQQNVFKKYKEDVIFTEIFTRGYFNCLTASAYYGLLLDTLDISYEYRESRNHVHPVAWPDKHKIIIETTDPVFGVRYFDENLKYQFVNYLLSTNIIGKDEYSNSSVDELFNRYYLPEHSIGMLELSGLQYMNDALFRLNEGDYDSSFKQIKKAFFLYPSQRMFTILQFIVAEAIDKVSYDSVDDVKYLVFVSRFPPGMINLDVITGEYLNLTQEILVNQSNYELYDEIFFHMMENMKEGQLKQIIRFQYGFMRGKASMGQYKFREALKLFEMSFSMNPRHLELQTLLISSLSNSFRRVSTNEFVEIIERYSTEYPELNDNGMFISLKMSAYLALTDELFDLNYGEEGLDYLLRFEKTYEKNNGIDVNYEEVGKAYTSAAVFYLKKDDKIRAKHFLERGLEIAPGNFMLTYRLQSL